MTTRHVIGQEIVYYEAVFKISKLMDQFCEGLRNAGILKAIRLFPDLFIRLLTYTGAVCTESVLQAIQVPQEEAPSEALMCHLRKFITEAPEEGKS